MSSLKKLKELVNKATIFYNPNLANYWHTITPCNIINPTKSLDKYYLDFSVKANYLGEFDKNGIPLFGFGKEIPLQHHPVVICQYALGLYEKLHQLNYEDEKYIEKFLKQAEWLVNSAVYNNNSALWFFNFDVQRYKLKSPWISAMAQGEAISVLLRAYGITNNKKYLQISENALSPFECNINNGGVLNSFNSSLIYEEYPSEKASGVLNGFIFALFGLYDLKLLNNSKAEKLFSDGFLNLLELLKFYDLNYWSRYDLYDYPLENPASFTYHSLHVEQLKALYILTSEIKIKAYIEKWENNLKGKFNKTKALINKTRYLYKIKTS